MLVGTSAFCASSPYLQTGPVAMTSLLTLGALTAVAGPPSADYIGLAATLAIVVGLTRVILGVVGAGFVAYFMSRPVMTGFTTAAAILILSSQLPTALGVPTSELGFLEAAVWAAMHVGSWDIPSVVLTLITVGLVLGGRRLHPLFPGVGVAVVAGVGYSVITGYGGPVVGEISAGLPAFSLALDWSALPQLAIPGVVIALVGFAEPAAISRHFAAQDRRPWNPDREFVSQGVANLASGLSGGFPVGGSFSRSSINRLAGAKTRWSGAFTGIAVLAFLPVAGILASLPRAVLAAIVISAVVKLVQLRSLIRISRYSRAQAIASWSTFAATLVLAPRIDLAIIGGIGLAVLVHLWRELWLPVHVEFRDKTLHLTPSGVLFFASAPGLGHVMIQQLATHPNADHLVIHLERLGRVDFTGGLALMSVTEEAQEAGLTVRLEGTPAHSRRVLTRLFGTNSPLLEFDGAEQLNGGGPIAEGDVATPEATTSEAPANQP